MYANDNWFVLSSTFTLSSASPRNKALWNRDMESPLKNTEIEMEIEMKEADVEKMEKNKQ